MSEHDEREALRNRIAFAVITGSNGERAATHAKEFQTGNWVDALRSADAVLAALPAPAPAARMDHSEAADFVERYGLTDECIAEIAAPQPPAPGDDIAAIVAWLRKGAWFGHHIGPASKASFERMATAIENGDYKP